MGNMCRGGDGSGERRGHLLGMYKITVCLSDLCFPAQAYMYVYYSAGHLVT